MNTTSPHATAAWQAIERERRRDAMVRTTSVLAWAATFLILMIFAAIMVQRIAFVKQRVAVGAELPGAVWDAMLPLVAVAGVLCLLIAVLATVGMFLRLRTTSLIEIQLRLAALEDLIRADDRE